MRSSEAEKAMGKSLLRFEEFYQAEPTGFQLSGAVGQLRGRFGTSRKYLLKITRQFGAFRGEGRSRLNFVPLVFSDSKCFNKLL